MQIRTRTTKTGNTTTSFIRWAWNSDKKTSVAETIGHVSDINADHSGLLAKMTPDEQSDFTGWLEATKTGLERDALKDTDLSDTLNKIKRATAVKALDSQSIASLTADAKAILSVLKRAGKATLRAPVSA